MSVNRFVDPRALARIKDLDLIARTVVDGFMAGLHRSAHLGVSTDFAEHRPYMPGDDIRRVDWRLFGRTDRLYVKEFEAETNANVLALMDVSASMTYASGAVSKLDYARFLAASLVYFSARQRDRVGVIAFDRDVVAQVPATGRQLDTVLHTIGSVEAGQAGELETPMRRIAQGVRRRSILALISDLYEDPQDVRRALQRLALRGNDVVVFHLLDPQELAFDFNEPRQFEDLETGERFPVVPERLRADYRRLMAEHLDAIAGELGECRIDYCQVNTAQPLDHALFDYLSKRQRLQRVR